MHRTSRLSVLIILATLILIVATGCFQDAGGEGLQATTIAQSVATFTPFPTLEPSPTPEAVDTEEATEDVALTETAIVVGQAITETPTTELIVTETPTPEEFGSVNGSNPNQEDAALTATSIIASATARYLQTELALTQQFEFPTPTDSFQAPLPSLTPTADFGQGGGAIPTQPILTGADCIHEVRVGDNLFRLSLYYGLTIDQIAQRNGITNINLIIFRQKLVIPGCGTTGNPPPPTTYPDGTTPGPNPGRSYTVVQGDNLFRISLRYGVPIQSIAAANGIANINLIYIGQVLYIP